MKLTASQDACLRAMEVPLWQLRAAASEETSAFQILQQGRFSLATQPPKTSDEIALWQAIAKAIAVTTITDAEVCPEGCLQLGCDGLPKLSDMLREPTLKAVLWKRLQQ